LSIEPSLSRVTPFTDRPDSAHTPFVTTLFKDLEFTSNFDELSPSGMQRQLSHDMSPKTPLISCARGIVVNNLKIDVSKKNKISRTQSESSIT
jgi:hypothetical protein